MSFLSFLIIYVEVATSKAYGNKYVRLNSLNNPFLNSSLFFPPRKYVYWYPGKHKLKFIEKSNAIHQTGIN